MKSISLLVSLFILTSIAEATPAHDHKDHGKKGELCNFFPANRLRFGVRNDGRQMTHSQFAKILQATESVYKPVFKALGLGNFNIVNRWHDDSVNACASIGAPCSSQTMPTTNDRFVEIYGGLARHPSITPEGLMLVICHEIGHHLGGYPRYNNNQEVMATEGQSDYFASAKCARAIYAAMPPKSNQNWLWTYKNRIPMEVQAPCLANFPAGSESLIYCLRSSLAGHSLASVLASVSGGDARTLSFTKKDPAVVEQTFESHPEAQCRLDTYVAGAICRADPRIPFSFANPVQGACTGNLPGTRPLCWYKDPLALRLR